MKKGIATALTKRVNIVKFGCWFSLQKCQNTIFLQPYTYTWNRIFYVIDLLPDFVEACTSTVQRNALDASKR